MTFPNNVVVESEPRDCSQGDREALTFRRGYDRQTTKSEEERKRRSVCVKGVELGSSYILMPSEFCGQRKGYRAPDLCLKLAGSLMQIC